ncbi:MAG: hypothetical protein AAFQ98_24030 [Bacteroidota bacterium]
MYPCTMAGESISNSPQIPNLQDGDLLPIVDISETDITNKNKHLTVGQLKGAMGGDEWTLDTSQDSTNANLGNVNLGATTSAQDLLQKLLYPAVGPVATLAIVGGGTREFGDDRFVMIDWGFVEKTNPVTEIFLNGNELSPEEQEENYEFDAPMPYGDTVYTLVVNDDQGLSATQSVTLYYRHRRTFWLANEPHSSAPVTSGVINDNLAGSEYATTRVQTHTQDFQGKYPTLAWPSTFGDPQFFIGGFANNDWTKVRSNWQHANQLGYDHTYDVWQKNTPMVGTTTLEIK